MRSVDIPSWWTLLTWPRFGRNHWPTVATVVIETFVLLFGTKAALSTSPFWWFLVLAVVIFHTIVGMLIITSQIQDVIMNDV